MGDLDPLEKSGIAMALRVLPFAFERCGQCKRYGTLYSCIGGVGGDHASWVIRCLAFGFGYGGSGLDTTATVNAIVR